MKGLANSGMSLDHYAKVAIPSAYSHDYLRKADMRKLSRHQHMIMRSLDKLTSRMLDWAIEVGPLVEEGCQMYNDFNSDLTYVQHCEKLLATKTVEKFSKNDKLMCNKLYKKYYIKESFDEDYYRSYV